ncbi:pyruvate formate lyase family protein [Escherichia coli]
MVQPPVCTERARHYTEAYQAHLARPLPVRRALALAHHLKQRTIWIKHDELIVGDQASQVRAAPLFPEYTVSWIEKEIDELADRPGAGFAVSETDKAIIHALTPFWRGQTVQGSLLRPLYRRTESAAGERHHQGRGQRDLGGCSPRGQL